MEVLTNDDDGWFYLPGDQPGEILRAVSGEDIGEGKVINEIYADLPKDLLFLLSRC